MSTAPATSPPAVVETATSSVAGASRHRAPARWPCHRPGSGASALGAAAARWPVLGILAVCALWAAALRGDDRSTSAALATVLPTAPEALVAYLCDPYLIVFFLVPAVLAMTTAGMTSAADYPVLSRTRTSARWLWWTVGTAVVPVGAVVIVWFLAGVVTTAGLALSAAPIGAAGIARSQIFQALAEHAGASVVPVWAYVPAQVLLFGVGLVALRTVLALVYLLTRSLGVLALAGAGLWLATVLSFKLPFVANVGPIDALALHQAGQYLPWWATAAIPAATIAALLAIASGVDYAVAPRRAAAGGSRDALAVVSDLARRPGVVYAAVVTLAVLTVTPQVAATATSPWDVLLAVAWGASPDGVAPVTFSLFTIVIVGFAHLVSVQLDEQLGDRLPYMMIRHRSMAAWALRLLARFAAQGGAVLAGLFALTALLGHLLVHPGAAPAGAGVDGAPVFSAAVIHQFALNGFLQLLAYAGALFLLAWWTRASIWSLGALALIVALHLPGANAGGWIPVGINSVGMLTTADPTRLSVELVAVDALLVTAVLVSVTRTPSITHERS